MQTARLLVATLMIASVQALMLPSVPARLVSASGSSRTTAPVMIDFKFPWLSGLSGLGRFPGNSQTIKADEVDEDEVCYLESEDAFMSYHCRPYAEPEVPNWWLEYNWPSGTAQAIKVAQIKAARGQI